VEMVFSTKERAMAAMPKLMDEHCPYAEEWRDGLKGFGRREEEACHCYKYYGDTMFDDDGGVLISNEDSDRRDIISVHLTRMQINPPDAGDEKPFQEDGSSDDDDDDDE
jgi:hypothetical protein